jgi:site-specific DNA-cytosine methylase
LGYRFGAAVIDAVHFVPQSRPRVFFIAFRGDQHIPTSLIAEGPKASWHLSAHRGIFRYHGDGEAKLDLVENLATRSAKLDLRRPH